MSRPPALLAAVTAASLAGAIGCTPPEVTLPPAEPPSPLTAPSASAAGAGATPPEDEHIAAMLARVAEVRGLEVKSQVRGRTIDRARVEEMIRAKTAQEMPPEVLRYETEALVALGLVPPSYDAEAGMFALVGVSLTGFYEPADRTMYLMTDVGAAEQKETLAHELVHALQDQHYDLGPLFKYRPGDDERVAAGHALAEGDATSAALDVVRGDRMGVSPGVYAAMARGAIDEIAPDTPAVLRESLVAPYVDGYAFVQALRQRGDFAEVDAAWRAMPSTTEQVLHLDRYDAKEPAVEVAPPGLGALDRAKEQRSFRQVYTQVIGEQSLRIVLDAWTDHERAVKAAAGWGGDRYVLAQGEGAAAGETALAWHIVLDTEDDAKEVADVLRAQAHGACVARPDVGPFAWDRKKRDVVLTMGPYRRTGARTVSTGTCKDARAWVAALLAGK